MILAATVFILRAVFPGDLVENPPAFIIFLVMLFVGILYSFDFLFVISYALVKRISKPKPVKRISSDNPPLQRSGLFSCPKCGATYFQKQSRCLNCGTEM